MDNSRIKLFLFVCLLIIVIIIIGLNYFQSKKEQFLLEDFERKVLNEQYQSFPLEVKRSLINTNETTGTEKLYGSIWVKDEESIYSGLYYNDYDKNIFYYVMFLKSDYIAELNEEKTSLLTNKYFKEIENNFKCKTLGEGENAVVFCESFWMDKEDNKRGVGVLSGRNESSIFTCLIPKESEIYGWKSCSEEFA
jgi:hypothetical protein